MFKASLRDQYSTCIYHNLWYTWACHSDTSGLTIQGMDTAITLFTLQPFRTHATTKIPAAAAANQRVWRFIQNINYIYMSKLSKPFEPSHKSASNLYIACLILPGTTNKMTGHHAIPISMVSTSLIYICSIIMKPAFTVKCLFVPMPYGSYYFWLSHENLTLI